MAARYPSPASENREGGVAPAGPPHPGAGERRCAGEVQAAYGGLVAGQLRLARAQRGEWPAGEAGGVAVGQEEVPLVTVGGHRPPLADRLEEASFEQLAVALQPAARLGRVGPSAGEGVRREQRLQAEHMAAA